MKSRTLTLGCSYSRITKRYSLLSTSRRHGQTQTTASNRCLILAKKMTRPRMQIWACGDRDSLTRKDEEEEEEDVSTHVKALR